jgi:carboxymethylenebutenolidase
MGKPIHKASDYSPEVLSAFDAYVHGRIERRDFLKRVVAVTASVATAGVVVNELLPDYVLAMDVQPDDQRINTEYLVYPSPDNWQGYVVTPAEQGPHPAVLVIHENRGRNPYIEDVARRLALAGFVALAPDALTSFGGWTSDDEGRAQQRTLDREAMMSNWIAGFEYLRTHPRSTGKVGAVGFCYGGGVVNALATRLPGLAAGVPFYGRQAALDDVPKIKAALCIQNGGLDERILRGAAPYEEALANAGVEFESYVYEGAHHGFHNNSTPRYDETAATLAWERTVTFFEKHLSPAG